ncbi:MAG: YebC/PmpR family DNA-binding transcriptional regulator [Pseudanabaenaceae cyanobacterium]
MAGHSKWANIKRHKAKVDAVKGQIFAKMSRAIMVAARNGIPDPEGNFQLRTAIEKAKAAGIPNENIERAIAKGAGMAGGDNLESIRYEGYGPGGVAIIIEALTDNRNRTAADIRAAFNKYGGNLGETGCVSWLFSHRGVVTVKHTMTEEEILAACLEGGADTYEYTTWEEEPVVEIFTAIPNLEHLNRYLQSLGWSILQTEFRWIPSNTVAVTDSEQARSLLKLIDALDNLEDVQTVTTNFDMAEELLALA